MHKSVVQAFANSCATAWQLLHSRSSGDRLCDSHHKQDLLKDGKDLGRDASGNAILADVGPWLRDQFRAAFKARPFR